MTKNLIQLNSLDGNNHANGNGNGTKAMPSASSAIASQSQKLVKTFRSCLLLKHWLKSWKILGVGEAFGVSGGAMATVWGALSNSPTIDVLHCRHEGGAAFAATEAHFASDRPIVVFTTAGPGITNALTGLLAARDEGAKIIYLSACTSAPQRGRWAIQETSDYTIPQGGIFTSGALFNYATILESPKQLPQIARRLALGLAQPGAFVAHISIPTGVQSISY